MILNLHNKLFLRSVTDADTAVLCKIYSATRAEELERVTTWTDEQKEAFLFQQFTAQHAWYQNSYKGANFWLILKDGVAIGRLYLHENHEGAFRIIDISLLAEWRGQGLGTSILKDVISLATQKGKSVAIHVESFNPAKKLYERLGFEKVFETNEVYHLMERKIPVKMMAEQV